MITLSLALPPFVTTIVACSDNNGVTVSMRSMYSTTALTTKISKGFNNISKLLCHILSSVSNF